MGRDGKRRVDDGLTAQVMAGILPTNRLALVTKVMATPHIQASGSIFLICNSL